MFDVSLLTAVFWLALESLLQIMNTHLPKKESYGQDLTAQEVSQWLTDEKAGYPQLTETSRKSAQID